MGIRYFLRNWNGIVYRTIWHSFGPCWQLISFCSSWRRTCFVEAHFKSKMNGMIRKKCSLCAMMCIWSNLETHYHTKTPDQFTTQELMWIGYLVQALTTIRKCCDKFLLVFWIIQHNNMELLVSTIIPNVCLILHVLVLCFQADLPDKKVMVVKYEHHHFLRMSMFGQQQQQPTYLDNILQQSLNSFSNRLFECTKELSLICIYLSSIQGLNLLKIVMQPNSCEKNTSTMKKVHQTWFVTAFRLFWFSCELL